MSWPRQCGACGSMDIQPGAEHIQCLACGRLTGAHGVVVPLEVQHSRENPL
jgi:hypothetical protein